VDATSWERLGFGLATPFLGGLEAATLLGGYDQSSMLLWVTDDRLTFESKTVHKGAGHSM
jgi:hypothetical protein